MWLREGSQGPEKKKPAHRRTASPLEHRPDMPSNSKGCQNSPHIRARGQRAGHPPGASVASPARTRTGSSIRN